MQRSESKIRDDELTPDGKRKCKHLPATPKSRVQFLDQRTQSNDSEQQHRDKRSREEAREPPTPPVVERSNHSINTAFRHPPTILSLSPRQISLSSTSNDSAQSDFDRTELASAFALASLARTASNASDSSQVLYRPKTEMHKGVFKSALTSENAGKPSPCSPPKKMSTHLLAPPNNHQLSGPMKHPSPPINSFRGTTPRHQKYPPHLPPHAVSSWRSGGPMRPVGRPYPYPRSNMPLFHGAPNHYPVPPRPPPGLQYPRQYNFQASQHQNKWFCDFCNVAAFSTFEEAIAHEKKCQGGINQNSFQRRQPNEADRDSSHTSLSCNSRVSGEEMREGNSPAGTFDLPVSNSSKTTALPPSFSGSIPLAVPSSDEEWLSEVNCYIRSDCVEAFSATEDDVVRTSKRGRITFNQVGIRCKFCSSRPMEKRAAAAVSYPVSLMGIYESVKRWQKVHVDACADIPAVNREKLKQLQESAVWVPTSRQYWSESAKGLGMADTADGIRFVRNPTFAKQPNTRTMLSPLHREGVKKASDDGGMVIKNKEDGRQLILPEDKYEVSPYVFLLMSQVQTCRFTEADRFVARSKGPIGFAGFECRHCCGHAGLGKYFPNSVKGMCTNSTSQNIHSHLLKCRRCPQVVKNELEQLKNEKSKTVQLAAGWRRRFFDKLWVRLHA